MSSSIISCTIITSLQLFFDGVSAQVSFGLNERLELSPYKIINNGKLYVKPPFSFECPAGFVNHNGTTCIQEGHGPCPDINDLKYSILPFQNFTRTPIKSNCSYSILNILKGSEKKESLVNLQLFFDGDDYPHKLYLDVTKEKDLIDDFSDKIFCWANRYNSKRIYPKEMFQNVKSSKTYRFSLELSEKLSSYICHFVFPRDFKPAFSNTVFAVKNRKHVFSVEYQEYSKHIQIKKNFLLYNRYRWNGADLMKRIIFATNFDDFDLIKNELKSFGVNVTSLSQHLFCDNDYEMISGKNVSWAKAKILTTNYPNNIICTDGNNKVLYRRCDKNAIWSESIGNCDFFYNINNLNLDSDINEIELIKLINLLSKKSVNKAIIDKIDAIFESDLKLFPPHLINKLIDESKSFSHQFKNVDYLKIKETYISDDLNITFSNLLNKSAWLTIFNKNNQLIVDLDVNKLKLLSTPVILTFKNKDNNKSKCVYWDYYYNTWSDIGIVTKLSNNIIECHSYHLTRFSVMMIESNKFDSKSMHTITLIELGISLVGVFIILIIAILSRDYRKTRWNVVHLSVVMFLQLSLLILPVFEINLKDYCVYIGAALHLLVLVKLCVCFLIAKTKFRDFVLVLRRVKKVRTKISYMSVMLIWICPGFIVAISLTFFQGCYKENEFNYCYPQKKLFIYAVFIPVSVLVLVITSIFLFLMFKIFQLKMKNVAQTLVRIKLAMMLWFLLGVTWVFSILAEIVPESYFQTVCFYIFAFVAPLEGFFVFFFYVILDKSSKFYWFSSTKVT